jgi:hypothetical protein
MPTSSIMDITKLLYNSSTYFTTLKQSTDADQLDLASLIARSIMECLSLPG